MGEEVQGVSIIVPIGPYPAYLKYLPECLESIRITNQWRPEDEIVLVDDMAHLRNLNLPYFKFDMNGQSNWLRYDTDDISFNITYIENDWLLGAAHSWNRGVVLARNNLCLLMGSDDKLLPDALDSVREAYAANNYQDAWYNLTIQLDNGEIHDVFNNAAATTKGLWELTGGFGLSAFAAPDAWLISIMLRHMPERLIQVRQKHPLYWCRQHPDQDTPRQAGLFNGEVISIRDKETARWKKPEWTAQID